MARRFADYTWRIDGSGFRDQCTSLWIVPAAGRTPRRPTAARIRCTSSRSGTPGASESDSWPTSSPACRRRTRACGPPGARRETAQEAALEGAVAAACGDRRRPGLHRKRRKCSWSSPTDLFVADGEEVRQLGGDLDAWITCTSYGDLIDLEAFAHELPLWLDERTLVAPVSARGGPPVLLRARRSLSS